ncbi:metallophosphoesterase family protein [Desulfallas thermosapovorans]|uniref:Calcineurin-like phosphoesterase family protein n=1 Tax=Desulfallas thermosapovorans DSM 6562 TaxID=1121431 RepID=A0A5S4ZYP9_9FIRM|nr:metallophosphoesterase [Desulfallas thermosapovorans]TYO97985.1 calcineurin-like phosphoesterase family protein [Desulfallas thermosapovorans DSM 6562]
MITSSKSEFFFSVLMAIAGAVLLISLFGHMQFNIEALQFRVSAQISEKGYTVVELPPLGTVRAHTHNAPLSLSVRLENIDLQSIQRFLNHNTGRDEIIQQSKTVLRQVAAVFIAKLLALALLGGVTGVFITRKGSPPKYIAGALAGMILAGGLLAATYFTYDSSAFRNPQYSGVLRMAPWMVNLAQETFGKIELLGENLSIIAENLNQIYERVDSLQPIGNETEEFKILHISDLHNNPAGMDFVLQVAGLFGADMIIDTGDITDFGTPLETVLLEQLNHIDIPYFFIPGNHDAPAITEKMEQIPNVTVVKGLVEKYGLTFYGVPDPSSTTSAVTPPDLSTIPRLTRQVQESIDQLGPEKVDIALLHNDKMARSLAGYVPVILFGHNHRMEIHQQGGSILINAGTSGAAGLRGLQTKQIPYSVVLLHFHPGETGKKRLVAADTISVSNLEQGFTLNRIRFDIPPEPD